MDFIHSIITTKVKFQRIEKFNEWTNELFNELYKSLLTTLQLNKQLGCSWLISYYSKRKTYTAIMSKKDGVTLNVSVDNTLFVEDR